SNVDLLLNNAGILNEYKLRKTIEINVTALIEWSMRFFEQMRKDKGGKGGTMINLASIYGFRVDPYLPIYQASKFAVMGFTRSFGHAYRYNKYGVRSVAVCPGFTETMLTTDVKTIDDQTVQKDFDHYVKNVEWQKVEDVSNAIVEVFEKAESGTAWLIEGAKPITEVK
ncbi:SDR family NAD(P)-dependent oxidoreductase, partial [Streptococcus pneumoniae]